MIYSALTDTELRNTVDNAPDCLPALQEAARRWCEKTTEDARLEGYDEGFNEGRMTGYDEGYEEAYDMYADK